jgi:hypothetical protein
LATTACAAISWPSDFALARSAASRATSAADGGDGEGVGLGLGLALGDGFGEGLGEGDGEALAEGDGAAEAPGVGDGAAEPRGVGDGEAEGLADGELDVVPAVVPADGLALAVGGVAVALGDGEGGVGLVGEGVGDGVAVGPSACASDAQGPPLRASASIAARRIRLRNSSRDCLTSVSERSPVRRTGDRGPALGLLRLRPESQGLLTLGRTRTRA